MSFELFHGIRKKIPSLVPGLAAPKGKRCLRSLDRLVETIFLGVGHAGKFFSSHRIGDLYRPGRVDSLAVHYIREPRGQTSLCERLLAIGMGYRWGCSHFAKPFRTHSV